MSIFRFPEQVNEVGARIVAGVVAVFAAISLAWPSPWLIGVLALGFLLRVGWGPTFSLLARFAMFVAPFIAEPRPMPGKPKRFAQGIGASMTVLSTVFAASGFAFGAQVLMGILFVCATLESVFGICLGCWMYAQGQRRGWIAADACDVCYVGGGSVVGNVAGDAVTAPRPSIG